MVFVVARFRRPPEVWNVWPSMIIFNALNLTDDAGTFECIAQNNLGAETTSAMLIIPGDKRGYRVYWFSYKKKCFIFIDI
jgi:hypothetical protein